MKNKVLIISLFIAMPAVLLFIPFIEGQSVYKCIGQEGDDDLLISKEDAEKTFENYVINDGEICLKWQTTMHALILITWVKHYKWSDVKVEEIYKRHGNIIRKT